MLRSLICTLVLLLASFCLWAQSDRVSGPVIQAAGAVFPVEEPFYTLDSTKVYKIIFDVMDSPDNTTSLNRVLNTIARFLNMHVQAGTPLENLKVACVFHNKATKDALTDEAYHSRYEVDNPNTELISQLVQAGVETYICGQSINARNVAPKELAPPIKVALSAMTVLIDYQTNGYQLIKF